MPAWSYLTIQSPVSGLYKEKGSKFLSFAYPVDTEDSIKEKIAAVKKEYFDARHHCFAWILGPDKNQFRAFDDGEPNHTAGDPILGQIKSKQLTNLLVVVVRYFGGTKLGVGGLITAYKKSAQDALNKAIIIEKDITEVLHLNFSYTSTPEMMRLVKDFNLTILTQKFGVICELHLEVKTKDAQNVIEKIKRLNATGTEVRFCP